MNPLLIGLAIAVFFLAFAGFIALLELLARRRARNTEKSALLGVVAPVERPYVDHVFVGDRPPPVPARTKPAPRAWKD